jgi:hypothetical protein
MYIDPLDMDLLLDVVRKLHATLKKRAMASSVMSIVRIGVEVVDGFRHLDDTLKTRYLTRAFGVIVRENDNMYGRKSDLMTPVLAHKLHVMLDENILSEMISMVLEYNKSKRGCFGIICCI